LNAKRELSVHVIGRGIIGLSIAYEMCLRGWQVTVLGPKDLSGTASRAAVGVSSLKGHILPGHPLFLAKMKGHEGLPGWLKNIERDSGQVIPQLRSGVVEPFFDLKGFQYLSERIFHGKYRGCLRARLYGEGTDAEAQTGAGLLRPRPRGAFVYSGDLWFDPDKTLTALETAIVRLGGTFLDVLVKRVIPDLGSGASIEAEVDTGTDQSGQSIRIKAQEVVIAAGAFTSEILETSLLPSLGLQYSPGETLFAKLNVAEPFNLRLGKTNYVAHEGLLRWGSSSRVVRDLAQEIQGGASPSAVQTLLSDAERFIKPTFMQQSSLQVRWGIRTRVRDRAPVVGPLFWPDLPLKKVWVAVGFYKNGLQLAGLLAHYLGDALSGVPVTPLQSLIQALVHPERVR
jgi:glycine/D-amino acid oxidase-like deaminating enzyme